MKELFDRITPEAAGVSSAELAEWIGMIERHGLQMHSILLARGDALFAEYYWAPFGRETLHRMYSTTKSYVSIALGLLADEGKVCIDDPIVKYFPDKIDREVPRYLAEMTIREMLEMRTTGAPPQFFGNPDPDRTHIYLNSVGTERPSGTLWVYDSDGSQVLCSLVERLAGMRLLDYLKSKLFDRMGAFQTAQMLSAPDGVSWGSSGLLARTVDMLAFARLLMKDGFWHGERIIETDFFRQATMRQVDNNHTGFEETYAHGYGWQIWRTEGNGFGFTGMGDQLAVCVPDRDLVFACTGDNQGYPAGRQYLVNTFFDRIVRPMSDRPLPQNEADAAALRAVTADLKLHAAEGEADSPFRQELDRAEYVCEPNRTGITRFSFRFHGDAGELRYTNAQGDKVLPFGIGHNVFAKFPQTGYDGDRGGVPMPDGEMYDGAFSLAWVEERKLMLRIQIIDRYIGNGTFIFAFRDDDAVVRMTKTAQHFLDEYQGTFLAHRA